MQCPRCQQDNPPEVSTSGGDESGVSARRAGKRGDAHQALAAVYGRFTERFGSVDVQRCEAPA